MNPLLGCFQEYGCTWLGLNRFSSEPCVFKGKPTPGFFPSFLYMGSKTIRSRIRQWCFKRCCNVLKVYGSRSITHVMFSHDKCVCKKITCRAEACECAAKCLAKTIIWPKIHAYTRCKYCNAYAHTHADIYTMVGVFARPDSWAFLSWSICSFQVVCMHSSKHILYVLVPVSLRKWGGLTPQMADPFSKATGPKLMKIQLCPGARHL